MSSGHDEAAALGAPLVEIFPAEEDPAEPERTRPERIGRYELCFELASGGMATVYLARIDGESGFEKLVALKRIHRHLAKESKYVEMFLDEARIASRITHPNVCSVFDFGQADGEYYIAMEYLVGEPLSRLCGKVAREEAQRRHPLLPLRMAGIIADACEGLHAAHELKDANGELLHVVHRDVSPRNLFVTYDGSVQVVDFGIASARQRLHHTATGQVKGTFAYMAPEQLTSSPIDRRVDVWSLGVALWEMLTLKRLFRRDTTANTVHAVLYEELKPPSVFRSQVPAELDGLVMKALRRDPNDRWQSAREMGREIRHFLGTNTDVIGPAELSEWMHELFPQGEARKSQLMEIARMAREPVPAMPSAGEDEATMTATGFQPESPSLPGPPPRSNRSLPWLASTGALVLAAIFLGSALVGQDDDIAATPIDVEPFEAVEPSDAAKPSQAVEPTEPSRLDVDDEPAPSSTTERLKDELAPDAVRSKSIEANPPAKSAPGTINLVTRGGWAEVYRGRRLLGSTPRRLTLPAGRHRLVLKPFGGDERKVVFVTVESNATKRVSISLE